MIYDTIAEKIRFGLMVKALGKLSRESRIEARTMVRNSVEEPNRTWFLILESHIDAQIKDDLREMTPGEKANRRIRHNIMTRTHEHIFGLCQSKVASDTWSMIFERIRRPVQTRVTDQVMVQVRDQLWEDLRDDK